MREIKFRIFDGVEMNYNVIGFDYNCGGIKRDIVTTFHEKYGTEFYQISDNFPLMQYTGIKDVNGKEIYEGDVVKIDFMDIFSAGTNFTGIVTFTDGSFMVENENKQDAHFLFREVDELRVIGNIYENEDLLEK